MKKKLKNASIFIILLISAIMIVGSTYYKREYPLQDFDQILFYLSNGVEYTSPNVVDGILKACLIPTIVVLIILYILQIKKTKSKITIKLKISRKQYKMQLYPIKLITNHRITYTIIIFIISTIYAIVNFGIHTYIINKMQRTDLYERYYVSGENINITFPEEKRNLVLIVLESMENTLFTKENGGSWEYSVIPELELLAKENINFSNTEKLGGAYPTYGSTFTAGGLVAYTGGIPLITPTNNLNDYKGNGRYLENVYTLGDILEEQGYNLEIMMGSDGNFGGRTQYFTTNGNYKIFDVNYAIKEGYMSESDRVWWGFEDDKLFEWSKEEILNLASQDQPFNYIMLTADTHFIDGYLSKNAENKFASQYENVHAYSSKKVYEFVEWLKRQDFYENTSIVIVGDHLGMQNEFYAGHIEGQYERTIYNVIINSAIEEKNNKNRKFSTLDMYPTILASIGAKIEGERLGLGTNLFAGTETLIEELGYNYFNDELKKNSDFYNKGLLGDDYYLIKKQEQKEEEIANE